MTSVHTCVIGGGITGLCAGFYAARNEGLDAVRVLEASDAPGGWARTEHAEGFQCDWGPNGFLDREPKMLEFVHDLGLDGALVQANEAAARRFIVKNGALVEIVMPPRFFFSPLLSLAGKARLLMEPFVRQKQDDEPETIYDFAARRIGKEAADTMVVPMVTGVFGGDAKNLSLRHCFKKMHEMEREYGSLFRAMLSKQKQGANGTAKKRGSAAGPGGTLTTFEEGIAELPRAAAASLGPALQLNARALRVEKQGSAYRIDIDQQEPLEAQRVILAAPAPVTAQLVSGLAPEASRELSRLHGCDISVVCTAYRREQVSREPDGFGFLVPRFERRRILGCIWTSSVFPHQAPPEYVLLRTMIGGALDPEAVNLSDEELLDLVAGESASLLGIGTAPEFVRIYRHRDAIPQYSLEHQRVLNAVAAAERDHHGLRFAGNAFMGVSMNDCVVSARASLER